VQPLAKSIIGVQFRQTVWAMLAAVILVLLIACVNVMNMQFGGPRCEQKNWRFAARSGDTLATRQADVDRKSVVAYSAESLESCWRIGASTY